MVIRPGHADESRIVHLTHTTLVAEALCGERVDWHGVPDLAVVCEACLAHALEVGLDVSRWVREPAIELVALPVAA